MAEMLQAMRSLMRTARSEKGFVNCRLYVDAEDSNVLCYEERWQTRQDCEAQVRSTRFTGLLALMESASEQPTLEFHFILETRGLDYVAAVRDEY